MKFVSNRRRFLSALGLAGAGAAVAPGLARRAFAGGGSPKRLIVLSTGHGTVYDGWKMRPGGRPDGAIWESTLAGLSAAQFSRALAPLHAYRDRLTIFDGLSLATAERDLPGYRHEKGWIHAWTGAPVYFTGADLFSTTPSLDQLVARRISRADRLTSLELQVAEGRPICHGGRAQQLPLEDDPQRAFDRVFGLSTASDPLAAAQGSVLDFARAEHTAIRGTLGKGDRSRLDTHFQLVRQLEKRVQGLTNATCPDMPERASMSVSGEAYDQTFRAMAETIVAAFSCDFTRVATLSMGDIPSEDFGWGQYLSGDAHNDFAHRIHVDPRSAEAMTDYTAHHAGQLAELIALLEAIPDADGGSLMDHTLIVWGSEMGDGWHGFHHWCALTAGGQWAWDTGRYLHFPDETTSPFSLAVPEGGFSRGAGLPHQHLLVSVANAMGLDVDSVGLAEQRTKSGERVALTGGVPGL